MYSFTQDCRLQVPSAARQRMASTSGTPAAAAGMTARPAVYVAAMPLRVPKGPAQALMSAGYSVGLWNLQHFMVLLQLRPCHTEVLVFDFLHQDPQDVLAAFSVLSQSKIPGVIRKRKLQRIPSRRCWFVGLSDGDAADTFEKFNGKWSADLVIGLVEVLTAERHVLDTLRLAVRQETPLNF